MIAKLEKALSRFRIYRPRMRRQCIFSMSAFALCCVERPYEEFTTPSNLNLHPHCLEVTIDLPVCCLLYQKSWKGLFIHSWKITLWRRNFCLTFSLVLEATSQLTHIWHTWLIILKHNPLKVYILECSCWIFKKFLILLAMAVCARN